MMALHAFDIPEDDAVLANWLEDMIAGPHLGEFVSELEVLLEAGRTRRPQETRGGGQPSLEQVLGQNLRAVSQRGLATLPARSLRQLFRHPELLLDLQDHVLTEGGAYWDRKLLASKDLSKKIETGWRRLSESTVVSAPPASAPAARTARPASESRPRPLRWFVSGLATAAAIAVGAFLGWDRLQGPQQVASGWGWTKPNAFPDDASRADYLKTLADEAEEWRRKKPDTPQALAKRITEFRDGCSRLILADHKPLPAADRKWLVERCRVWAKKLDDQLADLEAGKPIATVRAQVDDVVDKLTKALRDRASNPTPA
jgi:hypothetical protein